MPQSLAKIIVHIVFSTKNHNPCLSNDIRPGLFAYIAGILNKFDSKAILINDVEDHVHILCLLSKNHAPCEIVEKVKTGSSKWVKTQTSGPDSFQWQNGYGMFSVSQSNVASVKRYIAEQENHHRRVSFEEEFRKFLDKYEVRYDEEYVWG